MLQPQPHIGFRRLGEGLRPFGTLSTLICIFILSLVTNGCRNTPKVYTLGEEVVYWHDSVAVGLRLPPIYGRRHATEPLWFDSVGHNRIWVAITSKPMSDYESQFDPVTMDILGQEEIWRKEPMMGDAKAINVLLERDTDLGRKRAEYLVWPEGGKTVELQAEFDLEAPDSVTEKVHQSFMTGRILSDRSKDPMAALGFGIHDDSTEMVLSYALGEDVQVYRDPQLPGQERRPIKIFLERRPGNLGVIDTSAYESEMLFKHANPGDIDGFYVQQLTINGIRTTIRFGRFIDEGQLWLFLHQIWFTRDYTYTMFGQSLNHFEDHHAIMRAFASGFYCK